MGFVIDAIVLILQLALAGFVMWGGWLSFSDWFRRERAATTAQAPAREPKVDSFERVASLVLLALLCTTIVAAG